MEVQNVANVSSAHRKCRKVPETWTPATKTTSTWIMDVAMS
jgi:hypothetical protein